MNRGFTLIELSIVLVIIGLIVGGVLVGQDLIRAVEARATISQVEKFNTAVNTFRGKFGYLPGDINQVAATQFGFAARGTQVGQGDGNGIVEGDGPDYGTQNNVQAAGETVMFWRDLSSSVAGGLIEGTFNSAASTWNGGADYTGTALNLYLPQAKLGRGNYFYVYESIYASPSGSVSLGVNYYGVSAVSGIYGSNYGFLDSTPNLSVAEAYAIDKKMDDGFPQAGRVMAWFLNWRDQMWTDGTNAFFTPNEPVPYNGNLPASATTCYDNGNNSNNPTQYSLGQNSGAGPNCALSFRFQ